MKIRFTLVSVLEAMNSSPVRELTASYLLRRLKISFVEPRENNYYRFNAESVIILGRRLICR